MNAAKPRPWLKRAIAADEAGTERLGRGLAAIARPGDVFALWGDLGIGKTALARAFIRALTGAATEVPSPTFTIVECYGPAPSLGCRVHHVDLYRVEDEGELTELGIDDLFTDAVTLVEWPERLGRLLPAGRLDVRLGPGRSDGSRHCLLCGNADWAARLRELELA